MTNSRKRANAGSRHHVARASRWRDLSSDLWDLGYHSPIAARFILPLLAVHKVPDIRAGALYGIIQLRDVQKHIRLFRRAARSRNSFVRDAGIWGLSQSSSAADEAVLWKALWADQYSEIQLSAAYSLRVMPRRISARRFAEALESHPFHVIRLEMAERAVKDLRLREQTRRALTDIYPELLGSDLLSADRVELLQTLVPYD